MEPPAYDDDGEYYEEEVIEEIVEDEDGYYEEEVFEEVEDDDEDEYEEQTIMTSDMADMGARSAWAPQLGASVQLPVRASDTFTPRILPTADEDDEESYEEQTIMTNDHDLGARSAWAPQMGAALATQNTPPPVTTSNSFTPRIVPAPAPSVAQPTPKMVAQPPPPPPLPAPDVKTGSRSVAELTKNFNQSGKEQKGADLQNHLAALAAKRREKYGGEEKVTEWKPPPPPPPTPTTTTAAAPVAGTTIKKKRIIRKKIIRKSDGTTEEIVTVIEPDAEQETTTTTTTTTSQPQPQPTAPTITTTPWKVVLPDGWHEAKDPSSGDVYYYNSATGETSWDPPTVVPPEAATAPPVVVTKVAVTPKSVPTAESAATPVVSQPQPSAEGGCCVIL